MKNIGDQMGSIAETIVRLSEQSQEVGEITGTVEDLAEQSNLLAVNAAVEAAKAGEQGRGFSVVAQEIKSLAEQSKQSAREVQRILRDIQKATGAAVMAIEQGSKAVDRGAKEATPSRESVLALSRRFTESAQSAAQIAAANNELLSGIGQVAQAMENIREAGEQNVTGMKELESAAANLRDMGRRLAALVEGYRI
jgi:methyl-accepting chemotaxis protein